MVWDGSDVSDLVDEVLLAAKEGLVHANYPSHGWSDTVIVFSNQEMTDEDAEEALADIAQK